MAAYFVFSVARLAAFSTQQWFLLIPALFFIIYGAIGNATVFAFIVILVPLLTIYASSAAVNGY